MFETERSNKSRRASQALMESYRILQSGIIIRAQRQIDSI